MEATPQDGEIAYGIGTIDPSREYYAITLTADETGTVQWTTITHWTGFTEGRPKLEVRRASVVDAERMAKNWTTLREPFLIVNTEEQLACFICVFAGHALVERSIAEQLLPGVIAPSPCAKEAPLGGFVSQSSIPKESLRRFPSPKTRMRILKRDDLRCRICGRRPDDHVDLELQVHHIRLWSRSGLTEPWNLITVCKLCHDGLDPHEDYGLYALIGTPLEPTGHPEKYIAGVRAYRALCEHIHGRTYPPRSMRKKRA
ncbi:MAG: HNH endonuclease [Polyangiaceae bacterium]